MDESGARHGSPSASQPLQPATGADRISSLTDDLLLHILSHLGYADAAARKTLLSRRWRGLFSHLPSRDLTLCDVPLGSLEDALRHAALPEVRLLDITIPKKEWGFSPGHLCSTVSSVLREAARLFPVQIRFTVSPNLTISPGDRCAAVDLPRFQRATSIDLRVPPHIPLTYSRVSNGFPLLESLSLSGCRIDLVPLIPRCPCLRVLTVAAGAPGSGADFTIQSFSLQGLDVDRTSMPTHSIVVQAPVLKRLTMSLNASRELSVSIVAPILEKISWRCSYASVFQGLGLWRLLEVSLETAEGRTRSAACCSNADIGKDTSCSMLHTVNVLSLRMCCYIGYMGFPDEDVGFATEISKHMVTDFSGLELHLTTKGHAFGPFVWRILGMGHIGKATRSLRIVLLNSEVIVACTPNCPCHGPWDWSMQPVTLPNLEKVVIEGFEGEGHDFDFLKLVFRCAPTLARVTVRLPDQCTPNGDWCTKLHEIFMEYPSVEGNIDLIPGT